MFILPCGYFAVTIHTAFAVDPETNPELIVITLRYEKNFNAMIIRYWTPKNKPFSSWNYPMNLYY